MYTEEIGAIIFNYPISKTGGFREAMETDL